jgi:hypothetical protein
MLGFCGLIVEYFWKIRKAGKLSWSNIGGTPMKLLLVGLWGASLLIMCVCASRETLAKLALP